MLTSTKVHRLLKILAVAGLGLNLLAAIVFYLYAAPSGKPLGWFAFWIAFAVGIPLYGILYEVVKTREYLRDILKALSERP